MAPLRITELSSPNALLHIYPRQQQPQDCYLELDTRDGAFTADWNAEIGNAIPSDVYHGMVRRYPIPILSARQANGLLHELETEAQRVVDGTVIEWDGNNNTAVLSEDAQDADETIRRITHEYGDHPWEVLDLHWAEAGSWLYEDQENLQTQLAGGKSVDVLMEELDGDGTDETTPVLVGLRGYLESLAGESSSDQD